MNDDPLRPHGTAPAARGESPPAFGRRCIPPPPQRGCRVGDPGPGGVAPPSNIPDILGRRALPAGRIAALGATADFHHGLLGRRDLLKLGAGVVATALTAE